MTYARVSRGFDHGIKRLEETDPAQKHIWSNKSGPNKTFVGQKMVRTVDEGLALHLLLSFIILQSVS